MKYQYEHIDFKNPFKILFKPLRGIKPIGRIFLKLTLLIFGRFIRIKNPEKINLTRQDPIIFAFNHNNSTETLLLAAALIFIRGGKLISFFIDWMFGMVPLLGLVFNQIQPIYVYSKHARWKWLEKLKKQNNGWQEIQAQAEDRFKQNISLGIFPEGSRNKNAFRLKRGKPGLGQIILQSNVKVLPIGIDYIQRKTLKKIPVLGKMILTIGDTMDFSSEIEANQNLNIINKENQNKKFIQHSKQLASSITHQVMRKLASLCGKKYLYNPRISTSEEKSLKKGA